MDALGIVYAPPVQGFALHMHSYMTQYPGERTWETEVPQRGPQLPRNAHMWRR